MTELLVAGRPRSRRPSPALRPGSPPGRRGRSWSPLAALVIGCAAGRRAGGRRARRRARSARSTAWSSLDALGAFVLVVTLVVAAIAVAGSPALPRPRARAAGCGHATAGRYWALLLWFVGGLLAVPAVRQPGAGVGRPSRRRPSCRRCSSGFARTPAAIEAAWKYLILGSVGIGFALLGTLLAYASSVGVLGETSDALAWTRLIAVAPRPRPGTRPPGLHLRPGRLRHQGRPRAVPHLAARRAQPGAEPGLGAAVGRGARRRAVRPGPVPPRRGRDASARASRRRCWSSSACSAWPSRCRSSSPRATSSGCSPTRASSTWGSRALALGFGGPLALAGLTLHLLAHGLTKASLFLAGGGLVRAGRAAGSAAWAAASRATPVDGRAFLGGALLLSGLPPSALFVAEIAILFGGVHDGLGRRGRRSPPCSSRWRSRASSSMSVARERSAGPRHPIGASPPAVARRRSWLAIAARGRGRARRSGRRRHSPRAIAQVVAVLGGGGGVS